MGDTHDGIRLAEYSTLRDEILQNKKYIFERPLLIITAAGIASVRLSGEPSLAFLPLLLVIVLLSNLWFTVNRLQSNARIIAYITVVLEPTGDVAWIGWENALRRYRIWKKKNRPDKQAEQRRKYENACAIPDAMAFYPALWLLHVATVVVALGSSGASLISHLETLPVTVFSVTLAIALVFAVYCLGPDRPKNMRSLLEIQRATWKAVFEEPSDQGSVRGEQEAEFPLQKPT
jgi:hypothetical protein